MPDRATLEIKVLSNGSSAAVAGSSCARTAKAVTAALAAAGLEHAELGAEHLSVVPHWEVGSHRRRSGFDATTTMRINTARLDQLGTWIDTALSAGATQIEDPEFSLADPDTPRQEALAKAVAAARRDAETIARAAGGSLGDLLSLSSQGDTSVATPMMDLPAIQGPSGGAPPPVPTAIVPAEVTVAETIWAHWVFLPARR
jgi:hypothetical protein